MTWFLGLQLLKAPYDGAKPLRFCTIIMFFPLHEYIPTYYIDTYIDRLDHCVDYSTGMLVRMHAIRLGPIRIWANEVGLIRCIHFIICMFEFLMAYTSRCRPG